MKTIDGNRRIEQKKSFRMVRHFARYISSAEKFEFEKNGNNLWDNNKTFESPSSPLFGW